MGPVKEHPRASDRLWWCARRPGSQFQTFCPGLPSSSQTLARRARCFARLGPPGPYLGELATRTSAPEKASTIHREALAKATELGAPAEQARALAGLGRSQLAGGNAEAARNLRQALAIYQRIGTPQARLVQDTLDEHGL
jgi:hypothetical protein